jgi:FixJ family two-component response regulator
MIYIIDDDVYVLRGFQILFRSANMESVTFSSVEDFLMSWSQDENDVLILDIHMQGMNGCDLLKYLARIKSKLPVIVVSAFDDPECYNVSQSYGTLAYLLKPVDSEILIGLINDALKQPVITDN